ncbi:MAG TPA: (Fe-S)-binding protein [Acidobacteriota bacterium]
MSALSIIDQTEIDQKTENLDCIHCGMCLSACPTYTKVWREADSPRGRIYLINSVAAGKIEFDSTFQRHIDLCLGCRACESACPSGVQFERLLTEARWRMEEAMPRRGLAGLIRKVGLEYLLPHPERLHLFFKLTRWMQKFRLGRLHRLFPSGSVLERSLQQLDNLPHLDRRATVLNGTFKSAPGGQREVAFFRGCVMNELYFPAQLATIDVLRTAGFDVRIEAGQSCCGALHEHNGEREQARRLARTNIQAFESRTVPIITNSAGCGALLKHYDHLFEPGDPFLERARRFSARVQDISEFLAAQPALPLKPLRARVTYDDPCHLIHGQKIWQQPRLLLQQIPELDYVELNKASWCCGSAGSYSITQPEMSAQVLKDKIDSIASTGATMLVTANPGCMLQIQSGLKKAGLDVEVLHLVEILNRSIGAN